MKRDCCNHNCEQGDRCPLRVSPPAADRRIGPSIWRRLFGWILRERRSGLDRRK
jgi:hypothetical protein